MHVAASPRRVVAGRYHLHNQLGRGAMGKVWRAWDSVLAREVAVKEVRIRVAATEDDTRVLHQRTLREARTAARLNHPAVVRVFDVVEADGSPWIVMELVDGRSLENVLATDGSLHPGRAADLGSRMLGALATAHAAGILHRDVKPSNVLLGADGRAVLTDFGIATLEGEAGLTQAGMVMGTPGFTAPERVRGEPASPASDLWSLGATLFAAVEGRGPFDGRGSSMSILTAIANEYAPPPVHAGNLGHAIEALMRRDPAARPDAAAALRLLASAVSGNPPTVVTGQPARRSSPSAGPDGWHERMAGPDGWHERTAGPDGWHERAVGPDSWPERAAWPNRWPEREAEPDGWPEREARPNRWPERAAGPDGWPERAAGPDGWPERAAGPAAPLRGSEPRGGPPAAASSTFAGWFDRPAKGARDAAPHVGPVLRPRFTRVSRRAPAAGRHSSGSRAHGRLLLTGMWPAARAACREALRTFRPG